jgi:hypothetical protein
MTGKLLRLAAAIAMLAILSGLVFVAVLAARHFARADPDIIPYDVTSEGPDGYTAAWYEWEKEE